jgi:hypothetical protein
MHARAAEANRNGAEDYVFPAGLPPAPALPPGRIEDETVFEVDPAGLLPDGMLPVAAPALVLVAPAGA